MPTHEWPKYIEVREYPQYRDGECVATIWRVSAANWYWNDRLPGEKWEYNHWDDAIAKADELKTDISHVFVLPWNRNHA